MSATPEPMQYLCSAGESFDIVALLLYGDAQYTPALLSANPALCHLLRFAGGERLVVPQITTPQAVDETGAGVTTPPWKE